MRSTARRSTPIRNTPARVRPIAVIAALALALTACAADRPTLVSGDSASTADVLGGVSNNEAIAPADDLVAGDSAPLPLESEESTFSVPEGPVDPNFPFTAYMGITKARRERVATFILVGPEGAPQASGNVELPVFMIRVHGYFGVEEDHVFTLTLNDVAFEGGEIASDGCRIYGGLERISPSEYQFTTDELPEIKDGSLDWDASDCIEPQLENASLFDGPVTIDFVVDAIVLTTADGEIARFQSIEIAEPSSPGTTVVPGD